MLASKNSQQTSSRTIGLNKKGDLERLAEKYLSRFSGMPDATRLLLNMLADDVTDVTTLRNYVIRHEFKASEKKQKFDRAKTILRLSETYGLSKGQILQIIGG